jgi:UDP-hydrolysing UDP-N-acetyl-D-glucosamine 2-epimerase
MTAERNAQRTVGFVTVARSDYGLYLPVFRAAAAEPSLRISLYASGMHLSPEFGLTVRAIEADGFPIAERIETILSSHSPAGIAQSMGLGLIGFAQAFARSRPDILVVLGDRYEMHAAALAALPFNIPVAHIHGGELTYGAIDDALRHSMTKLSHLHFVSAELHARRVIQMGEAPWRVTVSGAPGLDNLASVRLLTRRELGARLEFEPPERFLLVTYHPVTKEYADTEHQVSELLDALDAAALPVLFTLPNADTAGRAVIAMLRAFVGQHPQHHLVDNLGTEAYFSAMALAAAMIGNSSSGLVEAPSFGLPVVNVGNRQQGRLRGANVIDTGYQRDDILKGIGRAISPGFRESLRERPNPYGDGHAAPRIVARLRDVPIDSRLLVKKFHDVGPVDGRASPENTQ